MGSLPNMDVCGDNIVQGKRSRSRTNRYTHPDEMKVCKAFYKDEKMDEELELAGEAFKPINADCRESGEEESDGESDEELLSVVSDDEESEAAQSASYVPSGSSSDEESESESDSESDTSEDEFISN